MTPSCRGIILPSVLFVLVLLGLMVAMFAFRVNADLAATQVQASQLQTRLAAEAGLVLVKTFLRNARDDTNRWYDNPDELHRIIVWAHNTDPLVWGTNEELDAGTLAFRFSIVADDPTDDLEYARFGVTDESAKLNLNVATEAQLLTLVRGAVADDQEIDPRDIVDAILDWRDKDTKPRAQTADTEIEYYRQLDKPYRVKNGPFDTVEELLLVKGVTARILYGEDHDRNGLMTPNEDDGDQSFPPDNEDGILNRGLYPYLTVMSYEQNVSNDNRPRIYLFGNENVVREQLAEVFDRDPDIVDYIVEVTRGQGATPGAGGGSNASGSGAGGARQGSTNNKATNNKVGPRSQVSETQPQDDAADPENGGDASDESANESADETDDGTEGDPADEQNDQQEQAGGAAADPGPIRSPASLLLPRSIRGEIRSSRVGLEHLPVLMDRTTTIPPQRRRLEGLINVNTAPAPVLRCLDGMTEAQIKAIIEVRGSLDSLSKSTTAWLVIEDIVDLPTFERLAEFITARGTQFRIEAVGYADHIGMVSRLETVVDMVGPIAQTIYYRDLTNLGGHFPIREEDEGRFRVR